MPANAGIHDLLAAKEDVDTRIRGHGGFELSRRASVGKWL